MRTSRAPREAIAIHEDELLTDENETEMEESADPLAESSGCTRSDASDEEVDDSVAEDMARFEESFKGITRRYRLINRIGEGTFSTVYKAEDLLYDKYKNKWDYNERRESKWSSPRHREHRQQARKMRYVAIKKIYVTSSPGRIFNELELLHDLKDCDSICPLITAFRHQDQVIAVLPFFQHMDFREYFREMKVNDMRLYFQSLFTALAAVHSNGILHRDIKPTNFLYYPKHGRGVLVDFGLAEREGTDWHVCTCTLPSNERKARINNSVYLNTVREPSYVPTYPKKDERSSRRANRAGTRGFRAPEVLYKCTQQTTKIDIWSAGVILLTLLTERFPFFHSADDIDALLELTAIFGKKKLRETALLHGQAFESNIPSYNDHGHSFEKIILWSTNRSTAKDENGNRIGELTSDEKEAVAFMERCFELNPARRISAKEALAHPFIARAGEGSEDEDMVDLVQSQGSY